MASPTKSEVVWVERHLTPHPARTYLQPIAVDPGADAIPSKSYVACMAPKLSVLDSTRERLRGQPGWAFREVEAGHDVMVTAPALLARTLLSLVG